MDGKPANTINTKDKESLNGIHTTSPGRHSASREDTEYCSGKDNTDLDTSRFGTVGAGYHNGKHHTPGTAGGVTGTT